MEPSAETGTPASKRAVRKSDCPENPKVSFLSLIHIFLPVAEADDQVGVFIRYVDASGIGNASINDGDFPVIPVVEVNTIDITVDRIEHLHLCRLYTARCV